MLKKQAIKKETLYTFTNLEILIKKSKARDNDALQLSILEFLEKRVIGKKYSYFEVKEEIYKAYAIIKRHEVRRENKKSEQEKVFDGLEEIEGLKPLPIVDDTVMSMIKEILTHKQYVIFDYWLDNGLSDYKVNLKIHNKQKKAISRILTKLTGHKGLFDLLSKHKALDSFTDNYGHVPYKTGNKDVSKYSAKPSNDFCYDIKNLHPDKIKALISDKIENKFLTGKVEYKNKLVKTGKSKQVKNSNTGLTGYKKYTHINDYDKHEKHWLQSIKPEKMVHLKGEVNLDNIGDRSPEQARVIDNVYYGNTYGHHMNDLKRINFDIDGVNYRKSQLPIDTKKQHNTAMIMLFKFVPETVKVMSTYNEFTKGLLMD